MKKIVYGSLTILLALLLSFGFLIQRVKAADPVASSRLTFGATGGSVVPGFVNSSNTGFLISADLSGLVGLTGAQITLDDVLVAATGIDGILSFKFVAQPGETLESQISQSTNLKQHELKLIALPTALGIDESASFVADYSSPVVLPSDFKASAVGPIGAGDSIGIGSKVAIDYTPQEKYTPIESIKGQIYGRELAWQKVISPTGVEYFKAIYTVAQGDSSIKDNLVLDNGIVVTDMAGNATQVLLSQAIPIDFTIDTTLPLLKIDSGTLSGQITQGSIITLAGTADPGALITLTVNSNPTIIETTADLSGNWRIQFDTSNLDLGQHSATLSTTNSIGNKTLINLGHFEVIAPIKQESEPVVASTTVRVAMVSESANSKPIAAKKIVAKRDVKPPVINSEVVSNQQNSEVASQGRTSSDQTTRETGINWSAWILLLAMVVLASALATAGYYGYGWILIRQNSHTRVEKINSKSFNQTPEPPSLSSEQSSVVDKDVEDKPKTRW